jgi:hypothetical protein
LAQAEEQSGKLKYSSNINELKRSILDESDGTDEE